MKLHTTFALLHKAGACTDRYLHLAKALGGVTAYGRDTPIPILTILEHNGLDDALWALRAVPPEQAAERDRMGRHLACDYTERVAHLWIAPPGVTWTPADCIVVARRYADGKATDTELSAAWDAAWNIAMDAAGDYPRAVAWTAMVAVEAAAWAAVWDTARNAAGAAMWAAAGAARDAAESEWQAQHLRERLEA